MTNPKRAVLFDKWLDRVGIDVDTPDWRQQAARFLGKSARMVSYYREGREIPRDALLLMEALALGYRPRPFGAHK